jgi:type VI protein secretion system component VasF
VNRSHWITVIKAYEQTDRLIEDLLPLHAALPPEADRQASLERETARTERLAEALRLEVTALVRSLQIDFSTEESERWAMPFVIHFDEMVTQRLTSAALLRWPLLQHEFYGFRDGGERFFAALQELLDHDAPFELVAPFLYSLRRGFKGRYLAWPRELAKWADALEDRIEKPDLMPLPDTADETSPNRRPLPQWVYYATAALLIALTPFLLQSWSNMVNV